ncbi:uncharacterized protein LOC105867204 isoform X1 [Microcebus murinus]|uniref:uncharacterized protein LOC105867204 isoform X1 n=2 Tax=Microcebus murinus TaxID=30608 RepID=UPI003F6B449C
MPRRYKLREDTKAMGAAQIMIGLIQGALGILWIHMYLLEEKESSAGPISVIVIVIYSALSGVFFIISGSCSTIQKPHILCKIISAIVMNSISTAVTVIGIVFLCVEISFYEAEATAYTWQNMTCLMLLQYLLFCTIAEMVIAVISIDWLRLALRKEQPTEESSLTSEISTLEPTEAPPPESNPQNLKTATETPVKDERNVVNQ